MSLNLKTALLGGACACILMTAPAFSHHPGAAGNSGGSGSIQTLSALTLPKGAWTASFTYEFNDIDALSDETMKEAAEAATLAGIDHAHFHSLDMIESLTLAVAYGITDELTLALRLPYVDRIDIREGHAHLHHGVPEGSVHELGDSTGFGDLAATLQWRFLEDHDSGLAISAILGIEAPTGSSDETNGEGEIFDGEFQPGSDSWDTTFGLALTRKFDGWTFDASGLYTLAGDGDDGANLGDRFSYGVAVSFRIVGAEAHEHAGGTPAHADGPTLDLALELNGEWHDSQTEGGEEDVNSGGNVLYVSPGLRFGNGKFGAFVSVGIPVETDMEGLQADMGTRAIAGVSFRL